MTYSELIRRINAHGSANPTSDAAALTGLTREQLLLNRDASVTAEAEMRLHRLESGEPLQYILGEAWFYGFRFKVSPDCLIPQPDTEHAVYHTLRHLTSGDHLLDLCTGSGCIAISILKENQHVTASAIDISPDALRLADVNAHLHSVADRLTLMTGDVLIDPRIPDLIRCADVIVSNPPYINTDVIATLSPEVQREPHIALDGGTDGMDFYRRFILDYVPLMKDDSVMILEIGYDQAERIRALCQFIGASCTIHRDFGGNDRVAEISRTSSRAPA